MWTYYPDLLAKPVPRYTSYPTAAEFGNDVGPADMAAALESVGQGEEVSLYLHIPFCREICWYCGCNTGAATRPARLAAYLARLHEEIALVAARLGGRRVTRLSIGGGSPNAVSPAAFVDLIEQAVTAFGCDRPLISVELDPRGFDCNWAAALRTLAVERVSLGVQTFDPAIQAAIGRVQPFEAIARATELLRGAGVSSINFDLMYGLPGQDRASLELTLADARSLDPDRLAVFGYAHVPHLVARQRRIDSARLPGAAERFDHARLAHEVLTGFGYAALGFDHFAKPRDPLAQAARNGRLRRNFQGFTDDGALTLIGLGASAISAFPDRLLQNEKNTGLWHNAIGAKRFATARGVRRSAEDRTRGAAIENLLTRGTAELAPLLGKDCPRVRLLPFEARSLVSWCGSSVVLAPDALPYARAVAATLDGYRVKGRGRFSPPV